MVSVKPLIVHWHQDSAPIYSACFQPRENATPPNRSTRLITAGGDNNARVWRLRLGADPSESPHVEYYSTLAKHERAVNTVEFDPSGQVLATAGDDGVVCLWAINETATEHQPFGADYEDLETWKLVRKCRTASFGEIYDLAWSPSGRYLAATSMDKVVSILDTIDGSCISALRDHRHYVQGVSWDPKDEFLATQSSDQRVLIYPLKHDGNKKMTIGSPIARLDKSEIDQSRTSSFHPESFSSFFRRLSFSPDGSLLVIPSCQIDQSNQSQSQSQESTQPEAQPQAQDQTGAENESTQGPIQGPMQSPTQDSLQNQTQTPSQSQPTTQPNTQNCALVYTRNNLKQPAAILPLPKPSSVVRFCPTLFELRNPEASNGVAKLPYRMIYAIATLNGVFIYDTERVQPLGMASNLHYSTITDLSWSPDGRLLLLTSIDGFCSVFRFEKDELGTLYRPDPQQQQQTSAPTSTHASGPTPTVSAPEQAPALMNQNTTQTAPVINTLMVRKKPKTAPSSAPSEAPNDPQSSSSSSSTPAAAGFAGSAAPSQESVDGPSVPSADVDA